MKFKNRESERVELEDGRIVWLSRSPAVMSIVVAIVGRWWEQKKFYVITSVRGKDTPDFQGHHCCPCGYLDWDEDGWQGAAREIWEETNFNVLNVIKSKELLTNGNSYKVKIIDNYYGNQPYFVNSSPSANRQNITLGYALSFAVSKKEALPSLSGINVNKDNFQEVFSADWIPYEEILTPKYRFAFHHDMKIIKYVENLKKKLPFWMR